MTLKRWGSPLLSFEVCSRATPCYTTSNYMVKLFVFKLKQIYFIIIFFHLWHSSIPLIRTNQPFFGQFWSLFNHIRGICCTNSSHTVIIRVITCWIIYFFFTVVILRTTGTSFYVTKIVRKFEKGYIFKILVFPW